MATSCSIVISPIICLQLSWLRTATFVVFTILFYANFISSSQPDIPDYKAHCASVVPHSPPTAPEFTTIPFPPDQDGYYLGGDGMFDLLDSNSSHYYYSSSDRKVLLFRTRHVHSTDADGVYKVEASLIIQPSSMSYNVEDIGYSYSHSPHVISSWTGRDALTFEVAGFWSKSTGKLCMVGSSSTYWHEGKARVLNALLNLYDVKRVNNITSLIRGTIHSLNSAYDLSYFQPISLLMFPQTDYTYSSEVFQEVDFVWTGDAAKLSSLPLSKSICSIFSRERNSFKLVYASGCDSSKSCNPLGEGAEFLPVVMSLSLIQCSHDGLSLRFLLEFSNRSSGISFSPNATFVAEGTWNHKKDQLCVVACRILNATNSLSSSHIDDCSIRMTLGFPSVWSITNTSAIVGDIWSIKHGNESSYFKRIQFRSNKGEVIAIPGLKYNYTLVERAKKSCKQNLPTGKKGSQYPDANSNEMQFDMAVKKSSGKRIGWGYASPLFVDDHIPIRNVHFINFSSSLPANSLDKAKFQPSRPLYISYRMDFPSFGGSLNQYTQVDITAEGIYYPETGDMCMVGCRYLALNNNQLPTDDSMDCNIFVKLQFPSIDSSSYIQGHIKSTREESDPLYLMPLSFSALSFYSRHARKSIWRMDLEIIMTMVTNTLVCFFVGYQILYAKKHPTMFPFISLLMLVVLILGHMFPLILNFEALFFSEQNRRYILSGTGGWLEANEVIVRLVTMVAFLLQVRLLQLVCSARLADENQKASWIAERKTLYASLPLYIAGGFIALFVNWRYYKFGGRMNSTYVYSQQQQSFWVDLRSYAGLILDGFLLPQILLNIFHNSRQNALSCFFYMGTTFARLLPHAYDLYRGNYYADDFDWSYMYADHAADYYSTAWDIIIPLGCLLFAAVIYLQQRNGGRCFLPKRFKEMEGYEKVPLPVAIDP
ncbi:conserved hypothetical protein [Ricinus communis]|uniref:RING-type E3 ubiquitin transferase n=1 Tax=Ricinus communis TaxID=3988 RepID=B9SRZ5_RICCO|nr:conserved hypothetical protein [Ricinus communis]|eukprot:XP_002528764.1 uncharacterized protein LOC8267181 [Ricinus communis]